jgi:carbonic anhydrase
MKKPRFVALTVLAPLALSACGGGGTVVSVSMHDVVHVAKHGLDHAIEVKGSEDVTVAEVLHGVEGTIADQAHYSYWHAEEVGGSVEVQFRSVNATWIAENPDVAMPELGTKAEIEARAAKSTTEKPKEKDAEGKSTEEKDAEGKSTEDTKASKDTSHSTDTTVAGEQGLGSVKLVPARNVAAGDDHSTDTTVPEGAVTLEDQVAELTSDTTAPDAHSTDTPHDTGTHGTDTKTADTSHSDTSHGDTSHGDTSHSADAGHGGAYEWDVALAACVLEGPVGWTVREGRCEGSSDTDGHGAHGEVHWGYAFADGPEKWSELSEEWRACADGSMQSPIDVTGTKTKPLADLVFSYKAGPVVVEDNGHTVVVNFPEGSALILDGVEYPLVQAHYHARSEHTIGGESFPIEWHFVHKAADGALAVVGVMVVEGKTNEGWNDVLLAVAAGGKTVNVSMVDPAKLLPADTLSTRYVGSLTTPPCSEGVKWNLLRGTLEMSKAQIEVLTYRYSGNNRPVQPLNGREVVTDAGADK